MCIGRRLPPGAPHTLQRTNPKFAILLHLLGISQDGPYGLLASQVSQYSLLLDRPRDDRPRETRGFLGALLRSVKCN